MRKIKKIEQLSPSKMMLFRKCPRQFRYRVLQYFHPVIDKTAMTLGSVIHSAIEKYYMAIPDNLPVATSVALAKIRSTIDSSLKSVWISELSRHLRAAEKMLEVFARFEMSRFKRGERPFKPEIVEQNLYSDKFHAYPDYYHKGHLIDWKTGKTPKLTDAYRTELWVQAEVLEHAGFEVEKLQLGFLRYDMFINCPKPNFSKLYERRKEINELIEMDEFIPNVTYLCWWCPFKLRCDYQREKDSVANLLWDVSSDWDKPIIPQKILFENPYA